MSSTQVLFGGLPLNVAISEPVLNAGFNGNYGAGNYCPPGYNPNYPVYPNNGGVNPNTIPCICPSVPGNGIGAIQQGQNPVPVVALAPLAAFTAVVISIGGVMLADITNPAHRDVIWGVNVTSVNSGQLASIVWGGPVVNTINGTGGWNFVINQPVYITLGGVLTQVPPATGWVLPVGFALSQNTIHLFPSRAVPLTASLSAPAVSVLPFSSNIVADFNAAQVFDITLSGNTVLSISNGVDGRIVTFRVRQDAVGGRAFVLDTDIIAGTGFTPILGVPNAQAVYQFQYQGASGKYICLSSNTY